MSKTHHTGGQPSQRMLRVAELIRQSLSEMLGRGQVDDAVLQSHPVTVISVRMSPDLKLASVVVMPLGGKDVEPVLAALVRHRKFLRGEVARRIAMRFSPDLRFLADKGFAMGAEIDALLASPKVMRDLATSRQDDKA